MEGAIKWAETFRDTFDPGDFYIEIQEHGITTDNGLTDEQMDRTCLLYTSSTIHVGFY